MRLHFTSEDTDIISHFPLLFLNTNSQFSYAIKRNTVHSGVKIKTIFFSNAVLVISSCYCVIPSIHLRSFMPKEFVLNINKKKMLWILKLQVDLPSVGVFVIWSVIWKFHDWLLRKKKWGTLLSTSPLHKVTVPSQRTSDSQDQATSNKLQTMNYKQLIFGTKLKAWRHKIFHIFHFLQSDMVSYYKSLFMNA